MTSSWDVYYIVFLSGILSLGIPAGLAIVSKMLSYHSIGVKPSQATKPTCHANRTILGQRINVRFFLAVNAALVLITLVLALIPSATALQAQSADGLRVGLVSIVTISAFAALGLLYCVRKGDMGWLSSFKTTETGPSQGGRKGEE
jgi:NADH:ubiquinone oxidoreductase subunit 3 (subunit A)